MILTTRPLDSASFVSFGQVVMAEKGGSEYIPWVGYIGNLRQEAKLNVTYMSFDPVVHPAGMNKLERHPFSHQMFVPLEGTCHLVVVCPSLENGEPDLNRLQAFHATGGQSVIYAANVWHTPRTVLYRPGSFIMLRWDAGTSSDTEFYDLERPFGVDFPPHPGG